ncbi:MAG: carboxypeptidase M32 [Spirochaetaceae bacterium]|nr:MAG: carboxypeptidase M32 [Spirochaetaceae bacterium]
MNAEQAVAELKARDREIYLLNHCSAILGWDQETYLPEKGVDERAEQLAFLRKLNHERETDPAVADLLASAGADDGNPMGVASLPPLDRAFLRVRWRDYQHATRLPTELVVKIASVTSKARSAWVDARRDSSFKKFQPHLEEIVELLLEVADRLGYVDHPYDALLDQYEPWAKTAEITAVFDDLRARLVPLVRRICDAPPIDASFLSGKFPVDKQRAFSERVLAKLGFETGRGRLDVSEHPFTTTLGLDDVRITTRFNEQFFNSAVFGTIHEAGHAFYEMGFNRDFAGTRLADSISLGIHESQSRFWENVVGRGRAFWSHFYPALRDQFPERLGSVSEEEFYRAINIVEPSLIRVEADEVTYCLHIILRFNLEKALVSRALSVKDLPEAWREQSREMLGVVPETEADGVLQDIHWSMGAFGYFPTYALGNLYAAQFTTALKSDIPDFDAKIGAGEFAPILSWLRSKIHLHGNSKTANELCEDITGSSLSSDFFVEYLTEKYTDVYGLR